MQSRCDGRLIARGDISFGGVVIIAREELVALLIEVGARGHVHHVELLFVNQHGLVGDPFIPGLFRYVIENILPLGAGKGGSGESFKVLLQFATKYGSAHGRLSYKAVLKWVAQYKTPLLWGKRIYCLSFCSRAKMGAGRPISPCAVGLTQRWLLSAMRVAVLWVSMYTGV